MREHGGPQQGLEAEKAERRKLRRAKLDDAFKEVEAILHELDGSVSGDYGTREMMMAANHLDTALLWAREALWE
jgi:hypothetical protein